MPKLCTARSRDRFLAIIEETRRRYRFVVVGFVVMPEHFHLLINEPEVGSPSTVMQVLKQRTAHALLPKRRRSHPRQQTLFAETPRRPVLASAFLRFQRVDEREAGGEARYMHRNPVQRGLVVSPEQRWSSYRFYSMDEVGPVRINEGWGKISFAPRVA